MEMSVSFEEVIIGGLYSIDLCSGFMAFDCGRDLYRATPAMTHGPIKSKGK